MATVRVLPATVDCVKQDYVTEENIQIYCPSSYTETDGSITVFLITSEDKRTRMHMPNNGIDKGFYEGTIVYAKRSKIIVYCNLIPTVNEN